MPRIGVLALQGAFREHKNALLGVGAEVREVRLPRHLDGLDGLVIPGGESTTIGKLMVLFHLLEPLRHLAKDGFPIFGTCAGMIVLAKDIGGMNQPLIGAMNIKVSRNAFGRQVDSFETDLTVPVLGPDPFHLVFIRAPVIESVGDRVEILARLDDGRIVAARERHLLAAAFHPELTNDPRFHRYFLAMVDG
jgi:pyridoxal 5'-phosphate synthase pdxT subunit